MKEVISILTEVYLDKKIIDKKKNELENKKSEEIKNLIATIDNLKKESELARKKTLKTNDFIEIIWKNKKFIYSKNHHMILPNLLEYPALDISRVEYINNLIKNTLGKEFIENNEWEILETRDLKNLVSQKSKFPYKEGGRLTFLEGEKPQYVFVKSSNGNDIYDLVNRELKHVRNPFSTLSNLSKQLYNKGVFLPVIYLKEPLDTFLKGNKAHIFSLKGIKEKLDKNETDLTNLKKKEVRVTFDKEEVYKELLREDFYRANIQEYSKNILTDPNKGYWDLDKIPQSTDDIKVKLKEGIYSRDSRLDVNTGGVIAIDFGTKSTVVMQEDNNNQIYPLRVGSGNYSKAIDESDYENPTVMEFIDIVNFMEEYNKKSSRPQTKWKDLTVSHTAQERIYESSTRDYSSIFSQLKQWCGLSNNRMRVRDKKAYEFDLNDFLGIKDKEINPIELYAYYIGLYINNMRNGIYMEYILSFPVTYSLEVKEKIRESFEKGIKKSLPIGVLSDDDLMKKFRVEQGSSEPAAYAVTALTQYGFDPEDEERVFYGIFDFGGGTTDFDFGLWREADFDDIEEEMYDYVIEHFGASGDRYLGGENLLELLAFEVFKSNKDKLLTENISFRKPEEAKVFAGSENLISDSQEASLNTKKLMEELRPLWENRDDWQAKFANGDIVMNLHTQESLQKTNFELDIDIEYLQGILNARIERGVISFFESLKNVFHKQNLSAVKEINIFLAGNSSKSEILKKCFDKYAQQISKDMKKEGVFKIFDPLQGDIGSSNEYKPNGKTGVAYGIIKSKSGGKIKVINRSTEDETEERFSYYIGKSRKDRLVPIITPDCESAWVRYFAATIKDFEFYYTTDPRATTKKMQITESKKIRATIENIDKGANIYFKKSGLNNLDIVVATEKGIEENDYIETVGSFILD